MLDLLRKDVNEDTLDVHIAKFFDTNAAADRLLQRLLSSITSMAPNAAFVRRKPIPAMKQKYSTALLTKDMMDTVEKTNNADDSLLSPSDSRTNKTFPRN